MPIRPSDFDSLAPRANQPSTNQGPTPNSAPSKLQHAVFGSPPQWRRTFSVARLLIGLATVILAALALVHWLISPHNEVRENSRDRLNYVWIPPGSFMMGCSQGDNECHDWEKPRHQVTLSKGFWFSQTEVTVGAFKRFTLETSRAMPPEADLYGTPLNPGWGDEAKPIVDVTWNDAKRYCQWVGGRLPTEAEWEYAARGGSTAARYANLDQVAWYADNSGRQTLDSTAVWTRDRDNYLQQLKDNGNGLHPVAQKRANQFGLFDMLGNVWEWVDDWEDKNYYPATQLQDPTGPPNGQHRGLRGGSWSSFPSGVRASMRNRNNPQYKSGDVGIRCVWEVDGP